MLITAYLPSFFLPIFTKYNIHQDTFVESGGVATLSALLFSPSPRVMQEAAVALYSIISDSDQNKHAIIRDQGLDDLAHAARDGTIFCQV